MVELDELCAYIDRLLDVTAFQDYAPNGLQVEGRREVRCIVAAVTASLAAVEAAIDAQADVLCVHHGYFWKHEDPRIAGMKRQRLLALLKHDISLLAYHLPLDAHARYGNNARLAAHLGIRVTGRLELEAMPPLVFHGELPEPMTALEFSRHLEQRLGRAPVHLSGGDGKIRRIAWCSGAAQGYFEKLAGCGVDAYLTGEASEQNTHTARESGVHFFAAGHHATERYGVQALIGHLSEKFDLESHYIEIANPV